MQYSLKHGVLQGHTPTKTHNTVFLRLCAEKALHFLINQFFHLVEHEIFYKFLLGVFAKLRKATITFDMSVRLSAWNDSAPTGQNFMKIFQWEPSRSMRTDGQTCQR